MEDKLEKRLKAFLPYIIIIGVIYLLVPALLLTNPGAEPTALNYIILIGLLPLTALLCCGHYSMNKENDFFLSLVAPIFFIPSIFLYRIWADSPLNSIIYLIAYFLCGYLGLTVGDILANRTGKRKKGEKNAEARPRETRARETRAREVRVREADDDYTADDDSPREPARRSQSRASSSARPRRVAVETEKHEDFAAADPYQDSSLDSSTTEDDIEAILNEIHQRRSGE